MTSILHFRTWISLRPVGWSWSNIMCSITGGGERLHNVLRLIGSKLWCPWQQKAPLTFNGENGVATFSLLLLIQSFLYMQVMRTCMKSRTSLNCGQIGPLTTELAALERLKIGKCLHSSLFIFDRIIIKVAGNQDRHKSLVVFDRPKSVNSFWSYFPLIDENFTLLILNISEASWPILIMVCLCWSFTVQSTVRSCRAGQLIVALFLGRLRPSKRLTSTKRGRPRQ